VSGALRRALQFILAVAFVSACTASAPPKSSPSGDTAGGPTLSRDAAGILLQYAAYDYGLAGALSGAKTRTVDPARYGTIARATAQQISAFSSAVLTASLDRSGPIHDRLVPLADGLSDLSKDGQSYADGTDPGAFARVVTDVAAGWQRLRDLSTVLPKDDALQRTIARGLSFVVTAKGTPRSTITAGPFGSAADAQDAIRRMGSPANANATQQAPFIVRVGPYADRASADAAAATWGKSGFTTIVTDDQTYSFARSGPAPDAELWREPARVQDVRGGTRKVAVSDDGGWIVTGSDDGYAALFGPDGVLTALPQSYAGLSVLSFSDDAHFFAAGGQVVTFLAVPSGQFVGEGMRFTGAATQILFVPTTRAFVAASTGATGLPGGGPGLIGGRAPDGNPIGDPFPIVTPAAGAQIAASDAGNVYIGTTSGGGYDIEVFQPGRDADTRSVARVPGVGKALAIDRAARFAAAITDQGTYRFALGDPKSLTKIASAATRDIAFAPNGTLYVMEQTALTAIGADGTTKWKAPLVDGRRLVAASRAIVVDGTDRLLAFADDGTPDELGAGGTIADVATTHGGKTIAAVVDQRRAVLFTLP
jgi:hypothetical protein